MTRRWAISWLFLLGPAATFAQQLPMASEAGQQALDALLKRCVEVGALAKVDEPADKISLQVVDAKKLQEVLSAQIPALTPPLRDALIVRTGEAPPGRLPGLSRLLQAVGEQTKDDLAVGAGLYY